MKDILRVGLLGYGMSSKTFHAPLVAATPGLELVAVSSSDATKVQADWPDVRVADDPLAVIGQADVDLIIIPTPNDTHFPLAKAALNAGKHVVVDKPFTVTLSQAYELTALAAAKGLLLSVFHNRRWDSDFLTVKDLLAQGQLGEVRYFESHFDRFRPQVSQRWREQQGAGSGIWYDLGPHLIDQALQLFGNPVAINADLAELRNGAQATDYFHVTLIYPQLRVVLHGSLLAAAESPRYQIHGTAGSYIKYGIDPQEELLRNGNFPPQADWGTDMRDGDLTLASNDDVIRQALPTLAGYYPAYYAAVCDAINGRGENPVKPEEAIQVMELIELGIQSAQQRKTLSLR